MGSKRSFPRDREGIKAMARKAKIKTATETLFNQANFKSGMIVHYIAQGKVSRAEGMAGKEVCGKVVSVDLMDRKMVVLPSYRCEPGAANKGMGSIVPFDAVMIDKLNPVPAKPRRRRQTKNETPANENSEKGAKTMKTTNETKAAARKPRLGRKVRVADKGEERAVPKTREPKQERATRKVREVTRKARTPKVETEAPAKRMSSTRMLKMHSNGEKVKMTRENFETLLKALVKARAA